MYSLETLSLYTGKLWSMDRVHLCETPLILWNVEGLPPVHPFITFLHLVNLCLFFAISWPNCCTKTQFSGNLTAEPLYKIFLGSEHAPCQNIGGPGSNQLISYSATSSLYSQLTFFCCNSFSKYSTSLLKIYCSALRGPMLPNYSENMFVISGQVGSAP